MKLGSFGRFAKNLNRAQSRNFEYTVRNRLSSRRALPTTYVV
jgi:hypothetical protein